ncbi:rod shape-determining protein, partial [bacterium]
RIAGDEMDQAIVNWIKKKHNLVIGEPTAEQIKIRIGSAFPLDEEKEMEVRGVDMMTGIPKTVKVTSSEIRDALKEPLDAIIRAVKQALEQTPPELVSDIVDKGIVMTGGGSLLRGLDALLSEETNLLVKVAENPLQCVARGAGTILENLEKYRKVITTAGRE